MSNTIESAAHSEIGASSYSRWSTIHGGCPGSVQLCRGLESIESEYAKEGTHAHTVASQLLDKHFFKKDPPEGYLKPTGDEMLEAVMVYVDWVKKLGRRVGQTVLIEHRFNLKDVHPGLFGTADAIVYTPQDLKLTVADYKHGAGIAVEVEDNLQLQYYALGALLSTGFPCDKVEIVVIQPRCEHQDGKIRTWEFSSIDLLDFAADLAYDAAEAFKPNAPLNPGKHCRFCPAAATKCTAIKAKAQELAKLEFGTGLSYDPDQLSKALQFIPALEAWIKKVHEFAYGEAMHGRMPPGWKLVAKRATRKWNAPEEKIIEYMAAATKKDPKEFYDQPSLKSPAQMEKLCSKQTGEQLRTMMISVSSGYNLAPESDDRPPVKMDAKTEFTKIEGD
jgi:hypothetical protein